MDSPCVNFLTEISPGPALAVLAFACGKTRTSLWASSPYAHPAVGVDSPSGKNPDGFFLQAGLAVLALRRGLRTRTQTRTSLRLSSPSRGQSSLPASAYKIKTRVKPGF